MFITTVCCSGSKERTWKFLHSGQQKASCELCESSLNLIYFCLVCPWENLSNRRQQISKSSFNRCGPLQRNGYTSPSLVLMSFGGWAGGTTTSLFALTKKIHKKCIKVNLMYPLNPRSYLWHSLLQRVEQKFISEIQFCNEEEKGKADGFFRKSFRLWARLR